MSVDEDDLRDLVLPPFRRCVEAGAACGHDRPHRINGVHCGHHHHLVTEVLKDEWGFDGFVMGDLLVGVRSGRAVAAGLDLEMPFHWRFRSLGRLVRQGKVAEARVDDAATRLLRQQVRFADRAACAERAEPGRYAGRVAGDAHRALAREVAERSMVLLRNEPVRWAATGSAATSPAAEPVLPLDPGRASSLAGARRPGDPARHGRPRAGPRAGPRRWSRCWTGCGPPASAGSSTCPTTPATTSTPPAWPPRARTWPWWSPA